MVSFPPVPAAKHLVIENVSIEGFFHTAAAFVLLFVFERPSVMCLAPRLFTYLLSFTIGWDVWAGNYESASTTTPASRWMW